MLQLPVSNIVSALQTAVSPVILISGLGLLLLTMTNRLGRTIDRARSLATGDGAAQIKILLLRAHLLRRGILCAVASALCAAFLVIILFITVLLDKSLAGLISGLFILCMTALIVSLIYFMRDVNLSLEALQTKLNV